MKSPTPTTDADTPGSTIDAFHRGAFFLVQPAKGGHRAGLDAMILAASVPPSFAGNLADLGAGAGAAGLAAAARCPAATVTLVERSAEMAQFARETMAHPGNAPFAGRIAIVEADVTLTGKARAAAGLADSSFDFVIMNPPFNAAADRASADDLRREAHVMRDGLFADWLRTASAILRPKGQVALIARPASLGEIIEAIKGRFGAAAILPVLPRAEAHAIRIVVRATRGSRAGLTIAPPLVLHDGPGNGFSERAEAIINGREELFCG